MPRQVFTAGEILTAANMNDLSDQTVMVFDNSGARGSAIPTPTEGMVTYLKDTDAVEVFDGSVFSPFGGKILQVVTVSLSTFFSVSVASQAGADITGLSTTITPTSASSKILVLWSLTGGTLTSFVEGVISGRIVRDSTNVGVGTEAGRTPIGAGMLIVASDNANFAQANQSFVDSPATTSQLTYKLQVVNNTNGNHTFVVNRAASTTANAPTAFSTITLMEVAG
jgi:hypothetical protein